MRRATRGLVNFRLGASRAGRPEIGVLIDELERHCIRFQATRRSPFRRCLSAWATSYQARKNRPSASARRGGDQAPPTMAAKPAIVRRGSGVNQDAKFALEWNGRSRAPVWRADHGDQDLSGDA